MISKSPEFLFSGTAAAVTRGTVGWDIDQVPRVPTHRRRINRAANSNLNPNRNHRKKQNEDENVRNRAVHDIFKGAPPGNTVNDK